MELLLADALLTHCRDPCALLGELGAWPDDGPLPSDLPDRLERLRVVLRRLSEREPRSPGLGPAVRDLALQRSLPLLGRVTQPAQEVPGRADCLRLLRTLCGVLRYCAELGGPGLAACLAEAALGPLEACVSPGAELLPSGGGCLSPEPLPGDRGGERHREQAPLGAAAAVETLWAVLPVLLRGPQFGPKVVRAVRASLDLLRGGSEELAALVAGRLVPVLAAHGETLRLLWNGLRLGKAGTEPWGCRRRLLLLSSLCERILPEGEVAGPGPRLCTGFWKTLQEGLTCTDCLTRKRALYLLQRALPYRPAQEDSEADLQMQEPHLFWWSVDKNDELLQFWDAFILIMETLEANQMHVIKPVFPKLDYLITLAVSKEKGCWLLHPSWCLCIYTRMFQSENKSLVREGVFHYLDLYEANPLPRSKEFCDFIIGPLLDAISERSLFIRSPGQIIGTFPVFGLKMETFLARFIASLAEENKGFFLLSFIQKMTSRHWCAVPILFISRALSYVTASKAWGGEGLLALRKVVQCTMSTHEILLRGAAQCYLLQAAINLTDVAKVSYGEIARFLMTLRPDESLCRGSTLWKEVCEWFYGNDRLFKNSFICDNHEEKTALSHYVQGLVEGYLRTSDSEEDSPMPGYLDANLVATMVILASDVDEMKNKVNDSRTKEMNQLKCFLEPLLHVLIKLSTNPYLPIEKADRSLQLLLSLLQRSSSKLSSFIENDLLMCIWTSVTPAVPNILEFLIRRLVNELRIMSDLDRCDLYLTILSDLVNLSSTVACERETSAWSFILNLGTISVQTLQNNRCEQEPTLEKQITKVVSMASLACVCRIISHANGMQLQSQDVINLIKRFVLSIHLNQALDKPKYNEENSVPDGLSQGWGKISARYVHDQWVCMHFILHLYQDLTVNSEDLTMEQLLPVNRSPVTVLENALEALAVLPSDRVLPLFHCMKLLVPKLLKSAESLCVKAINAGWKVVSSLCNTQLTFWPNLKAFVEFVFDPELLAVAARSKKEAFVNIKEIICDLIDMSSIRTGVFNVVINYCCRSWITLLTDDTSLSDHRFSNAVHFMELMMEACVFGAVFRRDQRVNHDVQAFIQSLGDDCAANIATESTPKDDHFVRICAIKFLCCLNGTNKLHKVFLENLVIKLLDKDELLSKAQIRYHGNSLQHRVKNRVWQTLLVLFPKLDEVFLNKISGRIFIAAFCNNQASIKYQIEWLLILILHKYPHILPQFWDCFCFSEEKHKTSICTFLSVLTHFDTIIEAASEKVLLLKKALIVVLQWCFNHNFSVRLYALIALKKLWTMAKEFSVNDFEALTSVIESSLHQVETMQGTGNAKKNWQRIQEHFIFSTFHPLEDYSLETIFCTLPSLSEVAEEEWIPACKFCYVPEIPLDTTCIKLHNSRPERCNLKPSDWSQQDIECQSEWSDVQKKIIPGKNRVPDLDLEIISREHAENLAKTSRSLIVAASLIDKPANLGGLCRTSEIFGASALVVDNIHCINDKQFQHLSVSSEQWLPLVEVKASQLVDYLQKKKTEGYTVIGVEQTAKSIDLMEYTFPEKSLLLLGNEREGIPVNLFQHVDVCVEIPQLGIIRSLNVHVSGALLIWEYTKQQITKWKPLK